MQNVALEAEKAQLKEMLREKVQDIAEKVENNLVDKYCYLEYTNVFDRNRTRALKVNGDDARPSVTLCSSNKNCRERASPEEIGVQSENHGI